MVAGAGLGFLAPGLIVLLEGARVGHVDSVEELTDILAWEKSRVEIVETS